jgi:3'-(hydroxy)phthioceranyl-2'-palmitoyl(stearoyl)-2-O-sulfo-trehalose (hydroxy)phthioceranyltransferase
MTITTFCLAGYTGRPLDRDHLGGELFRGQYQRRDVSYDNRWFGTANFNDGRAKAKAALIGSKGNVVALGQSLGARILGSLLDDAEVLAACPPSRCVFVLTGHPDRKYGGASTVQYSGIQAGYGYSGIPADCQYRVWDCANQYDQAADYPTNRNVRAAVENVTHPANKRHEDYTATWLGDPRNTVWDDPDNPNVRYVLAVTYPLPKIEKSWYWPQRKAELDAEQRPAIEAAYDHPFTRPKTRINRYFASSLGWDADKRGTVRLPPAAPFRPFD